MRRKEKPERGAVIMWENAGLWWLNKDENGKVRCVCERRFVSQEQVEIELAVEGWVGSGKVMTGLPNDMMTFRVRRDGA